SDDRRRGASPPSPAARRAPARAGAATGAPGTTAGLSTIELAGRTVLAVDVGGSHVKALASNQQERRRFVSGPSLTAERMVSGTLEAVADWSWDVVSVGIPSPVSGGKLISDPVNLGQGWVGFDFEGSFGKPTQVVNDAVMQAVGSYQGGRMLFL